MDTPNPVIVYSCRVWIIDSPPTPVHSDAQQNCHTSLHTTASDNFHTLLHYWSNRVCKEGGSKNKVKSQFIQFHMIRYDRNPARGRRGMLSNGLIHIH